MDKTTIETLIEKKLGIKTTIETHRDLGDCRLYEGQRVDTTTENSGVFANFFAAFRAKATTWTAADGVMAIDLGVRWFHRDGGENGASVVAYYVEATGELLSREEIQARNAA